MTAPLPGARAGGLDWVELWTAMEAARVAARAGLEADLGGDRWAPRAARFDRRSRALGDADALAPALEAELRPADVVLDVGAGAGRHTVRFARRCREVVAVEPSPAMRERLARRLADEALGNVTLVPEAWPLASPRHADVVFSSHVLYGVPDVVGFITAMTHAARRVAVLSLGLRAPADALGPLLRRLHGRAIPPRPSALEAFNLLHQLGLRPTWALVPDSERVFAFRDAPEDLTELCHRLSLAPTPAALARVRAALAAEAQRRDGDLFVLGTTGPNALLSWSPRP